MSYENAPATKLLATYCACCGRPLVDSVSVETGVGPECRKKHGFAEAQREADWGRATKALGQLALPSGLGAAFLEEDSHKAANVLVYHIAAEQSGRRVAAYTEALAALGYIKLASRIVRRLGGVIVDRIEETLYIKASWNEELSIRGVPGAKYSRKRGVRFEAPVGSARAVWEALRAYGAGTLVVGEKGIRRI